jgi:uncharacterized protein
LVYSPDAGLIVDETGKQPGRGAYLCQRIACWDKAVHTSVLNQAFKIQVTAVAKEMLAAHRPSQSDSPAKIDIID